jgi:hypothetical protein
MASGHQSKSKLSADTRMAGLHVYGWNYPCLASRIHKVSAKGSSSTTPLEALKASDSLSVKGCSDE